MTEDQLREGGGHVLFTLKNILLLVVGFVLGFIIKGQAVQNITMGYDDYKIIVNEEKAVEINELKTEEIKDVEQEAVSAEKTDNVELTK